MKVRPKVRAALKEDYLLCLIQLNLFEYKMCDKY